LQDAFCEEKFVSPSVPEDAADAVAAAVADGEAVMPSI